MGLRGGFVFVTIVTNDTLFFAPYPAADDLVLGIGVILSVKRFLQSDEGMHSTDGGEVCKTMLKAGF